MENKGISKTTLIISLILVFLLTATTTAVGVYLWKEKEITTLQSQVTNQSNTEEQEEETPVEEDITEEVVESTYPAIFVPSGLFTETERDTLTEKLVKPYIDYQKEVEYPVLAMIVNTSSSTSDEYNVDVVSKNLGEESDGGDSYIYTGFLFGSDEDAYEYWIPECFESCCEFSDTYQETYPDVVERYLEVNECE